LGDHNKHVDVPDLKSVGKQMPASELVHADTHRSAVKRPGDSSNLVVEFEIVGSSDSL
jgi:hypothetical protein